MKSTEKKLKTSDLNKDISTDKSVKPSKLSADAKDGSDMGKLSKFDSKAAAARFGELVMLMMTAQRYWHMTIHELEWLALQPLMRNQVAVATSVNEAGESQPGVIGAAIWARVSAEVDIKIKQQIKNKVFPVRLKPDEWVSGDIVWLLDVIAPTKILATKVFSELGRAGLGKGRIQAHPIVAEAVDMDLLRKAGVEVGDDTVVN